MLSSGKKQIECRQFLDAVNKKKDCQMDVKNQFNCLNLEVMKQLVLLSDAQNAEGRFNLCMRDSTPLRIYGDGPHMKEEYKINWA